MKNSLAIEKIEVAQDIINNKTDWVGFEFNITDAQNILNAVNNGVSENVIALMPLFY